MLINEIKDDTNKLSGIILLHLIFKTRASTAELLNCKKKKRAKEWNWLGSTGKRKSQRRK